jgi:hypothetical protein
MSDYRPMSFGCAWLGVLLTLAISFLIYFLIWKFTGYVPAE